MEYLIIEEVRENIPYLIRDLGLLESAVHRSRWEFEGDDVFSKSARIIIGVIQNHPYIDGNKRGSLELADAFLKKNSHQLANYNISMTQFEDILYDLVLGIASKECNEESAIGFLRENSGSYQGKDIFGFNHEHPQLIERLSRT
jgi:death on curing protein